MALVYLLVHAASMGSVTPWYTLISVRRETERGEVIQLMEARIV